MARPSVLKASLIFLGTALLCAPFADLAITTHEPWAELERIALGFVTPDFLGWRELCEALAKTVAFALLGVGVGAASGFALALAFGSRLARWTASFLRSVHELFWALLFMQVAGIGALTGVLAIALPYAGIFAKVYAEILEEADRSPTGSLPSGTGFLSGLFYARLPGVWKDMKSYTSYRVECGLRSSAVLGFIGLPTLGFHLEAFFRAGNYAEMAALLLLFYVLIATLRYWLRPSLFPLYAIVALLVLWAPFAPDAFGARPIDVRLENVVRFFGHDIVPYPLRNPDIAPGARWAELTRWAVRLVREQALPGFWATLVLSQMAMVATGFFALGTFPLVSRQFQGRWGRLMGNGLMVILRSTPEYVLAYVFLQLWGPSMLPALLALSLHNGGIIATLTARHADTIALRPDAPRGLDRYGYEILPRVYGQFLAFLFYRWEIIMRETAILGILGVRTLGFYVDSAIAELRFDRAAVLILLTGAVNLGIDASSRAIRAKLRLAAPAAISAA
jgi:phosphonate transport system permease protein